MQDIRSRAVEHLERAKVYFSNFEVERREGDKGKACEALWGSVSCLLNAHNLLLQGKPLADHGAVRAFARGLLLSLPDGEKLFEAFRNAEKLHANFYHMFLDEVELNKICDQVRDLVVKLESLVLTELAKTE